MTPQRAVLLRCLASFVTLYNQLRVQRQEAQLINYWWQRGSHEDGALRLARGHRYVRPLLQRQVATIRPFRNASLV